MAKKAKDQTDMEIPMKEEVSSKKNLIAKFMSAMGKKEGFEIFSESKLTLINDFISTGSYSLNSLISGSYFKGIPHGRITGLAGKKGVGKSFICANTMREAQKQNYMVFVFDSESSLDRDFLTRLGVNVDEVTFKSINTVNEFKSLVLNTLTEMNKIDPDQKILIVVDSLGNLSTEKEMEDAISGKTAQDMGLRAKQLKAASRVLTNAVAYNNAAMLITNHTYEQAGANPNCPPVEIFAGGEGFNYCCSTIINLKKFIRKEEIKQASGEVEKQPTHFIIRATTTKNRIVPEGTQRELLVHFKFGLHKWYGLLDDALNFGFFEKSARGLIVKHLDKNYFEKQIYLAANEEIWLPIIKEMDEKAKAKYSFSNILDIDEAVASLGETEESSEIEK